MARMPAYTFFLVFSLIFLCFVSAAQACSGHSKKIRMNDSVKAVETIRTSSLKDLTDLHMSGAQGQRGGVYGLGGGKTSVSLSVSFEASSTDGQFYCLKMQVTDITLETSPVIQLAKNLRRGSCAYNAVLRHERRHVDTLENAHQEFARMLEERVKYAIGTLAPPSLIDMSVIEQEKESIISHLSAHIESVRTDFEQTLEARQAQIDTPEEYNSVFSSCDRWPE